MAVPDIMHTRTLQTQKYFVNRNWNLHTETYCIHLGNKDFSHFKYFWYLPLQVYVSLYICLPKWICTHQLLSLHQI